MYKWKKSKAFYQRLAAMRRALSPALPFLQGEQGRFALNFRSHTRRFS
jgi:hypothetical protein